MDAPGRAATSFERWTLPVYRAGPAVAYRVNDWLSLGASVAINYTRFDLKVAIPSLGPLADFIGVAAGSTLAASSVLSMMPPDHARQKSIWKRISNRLEVPSPAMWARTKLAMMRTVG